MCVDLLVIGDFQPGYRPHVATSAAIEHAREALGVEVEFRWVPPTEFDSPAGLAQVRRAAGVWIAPGSPYSSLRGALAAIRVARTESIPLFGTCGGFQHVVLEYARNVLGFEDAQHAEYDPYASRLIVSKLKCSLAGRTLSVSLEPNSRAADIYGRTQVDEEYYCNFGVNPEFVPLFQSSRLKISGWDAEREMRIVELADHPFYMATLFVPQLRSTLQNPHPLVTEFVKQVAVRH